MLIDAKGLGYEAINNKIRENGAACEIIRVLGQRFIAAGMNGKTIHIVGTPGNALGAYLNGAEITVHGNAQDAVGDTMNDGKITVHGNIGDAAGYAMRGGKMFVLGNAGYRAGIHMKAYKEKQPVLIVGGRCGSFLGEYQAGGLIIVLGLNKDGKDIVSNYPCTGMHGGKMFLRSDCRKVRFPANVSAKEATAEDIAEIEPHIAEFCETFELSKEEILSSRFTLVTPNSKNPYKQMYASN